MVRTAGAAIVAIGLLVVVGWILGRSQNEGSPHEGAVMAERAGTAGGLEGAATKSNDRADQREREKAPDAEAMSRLMEKGTYERNLAGEVTEPFDATRARLLVDDPETRKRVVGKLILRAAGERDSRFQDLLEREDLRKDSFVALALHAYDFNLNGNVAALEAVLERHRRAGPEGGWDTDAIVVLGFVDDWDRTREALATHVLSADGTGGAARYAFWLRRRYLYPHAAGFPDDYEVFWRGIYAEQKANAARSGD